MSIAMLLKIFSDCCLCFAIVDSGGLQHEYSLLIPALICALSAAIAAFFEERNWTGARKLCALLPLSCLLLAGAPTQMTVLLFPVGYTVLVILRGRMELEYYSFRHSFLKSLILAAVVYVVACACSALLNGTDKVTATIKPDVVLRYGLMHLLCGVALQRQLRLGLGRRSAGGGRQMMGLLTAAPVISVSFVVVEPLLFKGFASSFRTLMSVVMMPLMYVVDGAGKVIVKMEQVMQQAKPPEGNTDSEVVGSGAISGNLGQTQMPEEPTEMPSNVDYIWLIIAAVFAVVAVILLIYSYRKQHQQLAMEQTMGYVDGRPKKQKISASSPRMRVRQIYREFLKTEKNRGMRLKISDTSESVLARISPRTEEEGAARLRQIYLSARYDDRRKIDRSQVEQAKQALKAAQQKGG